MSGEDIKQLSKMKKLIRAGKRRFQSRPDRDYLQDLLNFGISEEEAWDWIINLNASYYFFDPKPSYYNDSSALLFKRNINGILAYIKLKIEKTFNEEEVVCISFHKDKF